MLRWKLKRRIEAFVLIQNESKKMNTARERLYEGNGVVEREWGKERKDGEDVGCEVQHGHFSTDAFTHRRFYTWTLLHTEPSTYRRFYRQTDAFTDRQTLLQTDRRFYRQALFHTDAFIHRSFYTQTLLQTGAFAHRRFYTQTLLHACTKYFPVLLCTTKLAQGARGGWEGARGTIGGCYWVYPW